MVRNALKISLIKAISSVRIFPSQHLDVFFFCCHCWHSQYVPSIPPAMTIYCYDTRLQQRQSLPPLHNLANQKQHRYGKIVRENSQQQEIHQGDIDGHVITHWGNRLRENVDSWDIVIIRGKDRGIVAKNKMKKGTHIAIFGGKILDYKVAKERGGSHALQLKNSGKTLAIDGRLCIRLQKFANAAFANKPNNGWSNAAIVWLRWSKMKKKEIISELFNVLVLKTTKEILEGQEITLNYTASSYISNYVAY
jgi:hypothetical protein